jgi:hypothetical protein
MESRKGEEAVRDRRRNRELRQDAGKKRESFVEEKKRKVGQDGMKEQGRNKTGRKDRRVVGRKRKEDGGKEA